ncbi:hypothetical protein WL58_08480 [Burkholderia cepacia]|nr:hypothetical protein WL58_08480 [Burkholderia cepacia]
MVSQDDFLRSNPLFANFITGNAELIRKLHGNFFIRLLRDNPISQQFLLGLISTLETTMLTCDFLHGLAQKRLIALNLMLKFFDFILQLFDIAEIKRLTLFLNLCLELEVTDFCFATDIFG